MTLLRHMRVLSHNQRTSKTKAAGGAQRRPDSAHARLRARERFYRTHGNSRLRTHGYGASELAFTRWAIQRGALNCPTHPERPGSRWWRAINDELVRDSELAAAIYRRSGSAFGQRPAVRAWLAFLRSPSSARWYRAHTMSVVHGYAAHAELAHLEPAPERELMSDVLYRLLVAHSLVAHPKSAWFSGRIADPRGFAVRLITEVQSLYPATYPLTHERQRRSHLSRVTSRALGRPLRVSRALLHTSPLPTRAIIDTLLVAPLHASASHRRRLEHLRHDLHAGRSVYADPPTSEPQDAPDLLAPDLLTQLRRQRKQPRQADHRDLGRRPLQPRQRLRADQQTRLAGAL